MQHLVYLKYLFWHKYYVFVFGWTLGVPFWRLILHDLSKFLPDEYFPYYNHLYKRDKSLGAKCTNVEVLKEFEKAKQRHYSRNDHHPEYWDGAEMSYECILELVADWLAAGYQQAGRLEAHSWFLENEDRFNLHPHTRYFIASLTKRITIRI